jgi:gamma-glutamyltranspeptidase
MRNYFGLIGAQANAIAPRKRPLSSMSPTLVLKGDQPSRLQVGLVRRGHKLKRLPSMGVSQIVARSSDSKGFVGAADLRAGGNAAGW